ncbi:hypothetical protein KYLE_58 [Pantoea phage Kyle]|uniref:Uncharacterized protein n=1 Tax=Pantoea phage Kyle TaxID=2589665 RepID=A0A514A8S5_9CAUD|nr:hypothetical protein HWC52_gp058 [Pantoea phage Kyle]QDH49678.1 hypothetical protein KYLE_58 [Pantoea phage Kyle]
MRRRKREHPEDARLKKELYGAILALLVRLLGETIKDRLLRTLLIGAVGAFGYYFDVAPVDTDQLMTPPQQQVIK